MTSVPDRSFWNSLKTQNSVMHGLIAREFQGRFGRDNIGFLWVIAEPLLLASVITFLHVAKGGGHSIYGISPYPFTVIGYCLVIVFRNNFGRAASTLSSSGRMLYHAQVTALDLMLARFTTETFGVLMAFLVLMVGGILTGFAEPPVRWGFFLLGTCEIIFFSFCMACLAGVYSLKSEVVHRLTPAFAYFMFPLSGAFFTMSFLPVWFRPYFAWNPFMVMFETVRYGQFQTASPTYIDTPFVMGTLLVLFFWAMLALRLARPYIHAR